MGKNSTRHEGNSQPSQGDCQENQQNGETITFMNLTDIAKKIINEDTWGNNPSAAGGMSPGREPTATTPPPSQSGNIVDISNDFKNFKLELEKQEDIITKKFTQALKRKLVKSPAVVISFTGSKGSVGQIEQEYTVTPIDVKIHYMKDKYYVVVVGKEGNKGQSEYYLDDSQIEINPAKSSAGAQGSALKNVGGVVPLKPTNNMAPTAKNILPQG
jgi:hypothetical protein